MGPPATPIPRSSSHGRSTARPRRDAHTGQRRSPSDPFHVVVGGALLLLTVVFTLSGATDPLSMRFLATVSVLAASLMLLRAISTLGRSADLGLFVLLAGTLFWFYIPAVTTAFTEEQWFMHAARLRIDNSYALQAFLALNLFTTLVAVGYQTTLSHELPQFISRTLGRDSWPRRNRILIFLATGTVVSFGFYSIASGGLIDGFQNILASRTARKPWDGEGNYGGPLTPFHILCGGTLIFVAGFGLHLLIEGRLRRLSSKFFVGLLSLLAAATVIVESGTRSVTIMVVAPAMLLYFRRRIAGQLLRSVHRLFPILLLMLVTASIANAQRSYRSGAELDTSLEVKDNDFFSMTAFGIATHERLERYLHDSALFLIVTGPIPRSLWPNKPLPKVVVEFSSLYWGRDILTKGGNTMPSILGQYLMSWGWFGICEIGFALGFLARTGDRFAQSVERRSPLLFPYALFLTYLFIGFRFLGLNFFPPVAVSWLWVRLLTRASPSVPGQSRPRLVKPTPRRL